MIGIIILSLVVTIIISVLHKWRSSIQLLNDKKIKFKQPLPVIGNSLQECLGLKHQSEVLEESCNTFTNEDYFAHFIFSTPNIVLRSPSLIESITVKDFSHFTDRLIPPGPVKSPTEATLFNLCGLQWRATRNKFTPLFTSSKLKYMFDSLKTSGKSLSEVLDANNGKVVDIGDILSRYTLDAIGSISYGFDVKTLKNQDEEFRVRANNLVNGSISTQVKTLLLFAIPKILEFLGVSGAFSNAGDMTYFTDLIKDAIEKRKKSGIERPDFIQMLVTLKEKGKIEVINQDSADDYLIIDKSVQGQAVELNDNILIGAAFSFLFAGFHSSAMSMTYALFEMSRNPEVMKRVKTELEEVIRNEDITHDNLKNLKYLDNVIKETLRIYPTAPVLFRVCTKEYTMPDGNVIEPGQSIMLPVSALHKDPNSFPDPLTFNPDRFEVDPIPGSFLPFGDGPRICIGMRLALMEMKLCLAKLLLNYNIELADKHPPGPLKMDSRAFLSTPTVPIRMRITKIPHET